MATKLKDYFPMIREREEVLAEIAKSGSLQTKYDGWEHSQCGDAEDRLSVSGAEERLLLIRPAFAPV